MAKKIFWGLVLAAILIKSGYAVEKYRQNFSEYPGQIIRLGIEAQPGVVILRENLIKSKGNDLGKIQNET